MHNALTIQDILDRSAAGTLTLADVNSLTPAEREELIQGVIQRRIEGEEKHAPATEC